MERRFEINNLPETQKRVAIYQKITRKYRGSTKSAPCEVSDSAKPSHEIGDNIIIDWEAAVPLLILWSLAKLKPRQLVTMELGSQWVKNCISETQYNASQCRTVIAAEGENGEGKSRYLAWSMKIREKSEYLSHWSKSSGIVQISNTVSDGIQTNKANIQMMPEILEDRQTEGLRKHKKKTRRGHKKNENHDGFEEKMKRPEKEYKEKGHHERLEEKEKHTFQCLRFGNFIERLEKRKTDLKEEARVRRRAILNTTSTISDGEKEKLFTVLANNDYMSSEESEEVSCSDSDDDSGKIQFV
ncbi:unnamed protein product [Mytilus coruscus]|uniref:Uncharacterized protein n=1 Tax=Mytilus coruscus TaxID=42192 RepID=A0A6J8ERI4_MYTCO|nr:unnamed protein product [Mytilus coruscus]